MKMRVEHFDHLKTLIENYLKDENFKSKLIREYENGDFYKSESVKDLQKRFCFDVVISAFYFDNKGLTFSRFVCDHLYDYLNDDHIYTALKKICPTVERKF